MKISLLVVKFRLPVQKYTGHVLINKAPNFPFRDGRVGQTLEDRRQHWVA